MARGIDGLTVEELRSSREFWDDRYTRELLDPIPSTAGTLVEIGCGLARAAHELLPHRRRLRYLGVDVDRGRLLLEMKDVLAATAAPAGRDPARACESALARWVRAVGPDTAGQYAWFVPVFVTLGRR
jgi:hypothetical protein